MWKGLQVATNQRGYFPNYCVSQINDDEMVNGNGGGGIGIGGNVSVGGKKKLNDSLTDKLITKKVLPQVKQLVDAMTNNSGIDAAPKLPPKPIREQARVLFPYTAANDDELTLKEGDIITIISKDNEDVGWWKGELNGRVALFPDNFVEMIKSSPLAQPAPLFDDKVRVKKPDRSTNLSTNVGQLASVTPTDTTTTATTITANNISLANKKKFVKKPLKSDQFSNKMKEPNDNCEDTLETNKMDTEDCLNKSTKSTKLEHLTTQRPKIPSSSRRPPSTYITKNIEMSEDTDDNSVDANSSSDAESISTSSISLRPSSRIESDVKSSPDKKPPWVLELQKRQEKRKENEKIEQTPPPPLTPTSNSPNNNITLPNKPLGTNSINAKIKPKSLKPTVLNQTVPTAVPTTVDEPQTPPPIQTVKTTIKPTVNRKSPSTTVPTVPIGYEEELAKLKAEITELRLQVNSYRKEFLQQNETIQNLNNTVCF